MRFDGKWCFGLREARRRQNKSFEKLPPCVCLKTENPLISWDSYSRSTCELPAKSLKCTGQFLWEAVSREGLARESQNSVCKILEEIKIHFLIFATRVQDTLLATYSQKCFFKSFSTKQISFLEKLSKHK